MIKVKPAVDGVQVAEISGNLTENETQEFISMINQVFQKNKRPFLVLEIEKLVDIDDKGVRVICAAIYKAINNRGQIILACSEHHPVRQKLEGRRSSISFAIYDTASKAVEFLKGQVSHTLAKKPN